MSQIVAVVSSIPFFLVGLFILWKKLRDDYIASQIFSLGFLIYFSVLIYFVSRKYFSFPYSEWLVLLIPFLITLIYSKRNRLRLNEVVNALVPSYLVAHFYFYVTLIIAGYRTNYIIAIFVILVLTLIFSVTEKKFKNFSWYKSGKVGISGLLIFALMCIINAIIALLSPSMVFFSGKLNAIILIILALISATAIFTLSRKTS